MNNFDITLTPTLENLIQRLEFTNENIFITGKAGTGKSTFISYFRKITKKRVVYLAPTGVAAINIGGQTIHSFFKFRPDTTIDSIKRKSSFESSFYTKLDMIIIDEVSMVRADLLDMVDRFLRLNGKNPNIPFGGVQIIFLGDLHQLPPVVLPDERHMFTTRYESPYFFSAEVFALSTFSIIELTTVYRQTEEEFIDILNNIRSNTITDIQLDILNKQFNPFYEDKAKDFFIYLTTTNDLANKINEEQLSKLKTKGSILFGDIEGDFEKKSLPTEIVLSIKVGAQIMMINNDSLGRWVNGSIGKVIEIKKSKNSSSKIRVHLDTGEKWDIEPYTWKMNTYLLDMESGIIKTEPVGSFSQYPFRLAWAITIHKSQGKTFDHVIIDLGKGTFAHGQLYVALSRCKTLRGIILKQKVNRYHIQIDRRIIQFLKDSAAIYNTA